MTGMELVSLAKEAMQYAYAPYSCHTVGAALLGVSGRVYLGCNVENGAYSPSCCAERTAFVKAISEGERSFSAIAVVGGMHGDTSRICAPCGVCRQVMREFCDPETFLILLGYGDTYEEVLLEELLPKSFGGPEL